MDSINFAIIISSYLLLSVWVGLSIGWDCSLAVLTLPVILGAIIVFTKRLKN